jgi:putative DNA primase/helicase
MPPDGADGLRRIGMVEMPEPAPDDDAEIARLAGLSPIQCDRELPGAAEKLGCRVPTLRAAVNAKRGNGGAALGQGRPLDLPVPEPWPEAVDGAALLDEMTSAIRRYVVLAATEAAAVALWVLAVHAFDAWHIFPRLLVTAPEMRCGKTTLLDVLWQLVPKALGASNVTAASIFRTIEAARPTFLLDEADAWANNEDLRSVIDGGHKRNGSVVRTVGDNHEPRQFSLWTPIALAAIGNLARTIADRSVTIRLRRRRPDERIESLRHGRTAGLDTLARKAARWAADNAAALAAADPAMPEGIYNRVADNWRPLLAAADAAGGAWPDRAREAAAALTRDGTDDNESTRVLLLGDFHDLFEAEPSGILFTREILDALHKRDDRPWPEYGRAGKPITGRQIAALLKPLGISTNQTVRRGVEHGKGYHADDLADAWARYSRPASIGDTVTSGGFRGSQQFSIGDKAGTDASVVTDTICENPSIYAGCHRVTDRKPRSRCDEWPERDPEAAVWTG